MGGPIERGAGRPRSRADRGLARRGRTLPGPRGPTRSLDASTSKPRRISFGIACDTTPCRLVSRALSGSGSRRGWGVIWVSRASRWSRRSAERRARAGDCRWHMLASPGRRFPFEAAAGWGGRRCVGARGPCFSHAGPDRIGSCVLDWVANRLICYCTVPAHVGWSRKAPSASTAPSLGDESG